MGLFGEKITLIKGDIDRFMKYREYYERPHFEGESFIAYFSKFLLCFFTNTDYCFRDLFYYRLGRCSFALRVFRRSKNVQFMCSNIEGGGIFSPHLFSSTLNCEHIGYGCTILHNVTIGNVYRNGIPYKPYLESNIYIGANVVIVGDVHIGKNVIIGAGSVVVKSVPDNCTVVGNPAHIIKKEGVKVNIVL